jgi:PAS domain S-box-containing protein
MLPGAPLPNIVLWKESCLPTLGPKSKNKTMSTIASLIKRPSPSREYDFILNQLPHAALIWDTKQGRITSCNGKMIELTGKTRQELFKAAIPDIFPQLTNLTPNEATTQSSTKVQTKTGPAPVRIKITRPSTDANWILIQLEAEEDIQQKEVDQSLKTQRWEALHVLALAPLHEDLDSSFRQSLQAGQLLTGASFLGIYLPDPNTDNGFKLEFSWGDTSKFPESIPISEISHLRIPYVWQPGTRGTSVLHQNALAQKLTYLATIPVDQSAPLSGILMVGDQIAKPPQDLIQMLQVVSGVLDTCRMHFHTHKESERESKKLQDKLNICELIKNIIADGLILIDHQGKIIDINTTAANSFGYGIEEVIGKSVNEILVGEHGILDHLDKHTKEGSSTYNHGEVRLHRRDGAPILINLRLMPLSTGTLRPAAAILLSDLSKHEEFRQRSKQLEQQAVLGEVMAIFAHEVRNPINNIGMGLQVMASSFDADDPLQSEISRMKQDIDRLEDLMKSVLSVSRSTEYKMKPVIIRSLLESILNRWNPRMGRYKIDSKLISPDEVPPVKGDRRALEQVFTNLIQNAMNSMKASGGTLSIRIAPSSDKQQVSIDIIDTGLGIPPEIKEHIFDPFFTTNPDGTGLGLAITKRIIVAHNGRIEVVDSIPGGTIFRIQLPVV